MSETNDNPMPHILIDDTFTPEIPKSIYFGGAAFGVSFFVGVFTAMSDTWGSDFHEKTLLCGGSIGSIIALQIALGKDSKYSQDVYIDLATKAIQRGWYLRASDFLDQYVDELLAEDANIYKKIENKFYCGTTKFYSKHQFHKKWINNNDLSICLKGSYNIPLYCSKCEKVYGDEVVDGAYGFDAIDFPHGNDTLFIGACQSTAEINKDLTILEMLKPALDHEYKEMFQDGYNAFKKWNGKMKLKVGVRKPNYEALKYLWLAKFIELIIYYIIEFLKIIFNLFTFYIFTTKLKNK